MADATRAFLAGLRSLAIAHDTRRTESDRFPVEVTHKEQFRLVDGQLEWSAVRDDKRTDERRKELGIKVNRKKVIRGSRKSDR